MASNGDGNLNTPNDTPMAAPTEIVKKKRGRPRKSEIETPRKSVRQSEKKQLKKETVGINLKGINGNPESEEDWSYDEDDDEYLSTLFKKVNNSTTCQVEEDDDDEEEDEDDEDDDEEEDALFQEDNKDVYDFDQQSSVMSQQGPRATRRWLSQQNKRGNIRMDPREGSSWGSNIYSHVATLLNTREDLDIYSRFLKCIHINRNLDLLLADLCKPFRTTGNDGTSASLRSLVTSIGDSAIVVNLVREVVSDRFDNGAHRITNFVVVVKQPICGLRFCTGSTDSLHFSEILNCIDPKIVGDAAFIVEADKTDVKRTLADVDTLVVSDSFYSTICDKMLSLNASNLQRVVIGIDENKSLFGIFVLDCWNRAGVPYNRPRKYPTTSSLSASSVTAATCSSFTESGNQQSGEATTEFIDAFFVRMGGKKDVLHLVAKLDSRFIVYNVTSECNFAFKRHGMSPILPIMLEGMYSTFPEVLGEEKSVLVVPDQLYRSLSKTLAKEIQTQNCKFKKCVLLDKRTRLPLGLFFDSEVTMGLQVDPGKVQVLCGDGSTLKLDQDTLNTPLKTTTQTLMLVSLNGILVGFETSSGGKSITKCYEMISDNSSIMRQRPETDRRQSIQTTYLSLEGSPIIVQLSNPEIHENTFVAATMYDNVPYCKRQEQIEQLLNDVADRLFDLPLQVSLMDSLFRVYQRRMAVINSEDDQSGTGNAKCIFCAREYRLTSLYDHEARHLSLVKFKCHKHQMVFSDVKAYKGHREEFVNCDSGESDDDEGVGEAQKLLNISSSTATECIQCIKCYDYFPQMDMLGEHAEMCDGVSFQARTPLDTGDSAANGECLVCGVCGLNYPKIESVCAHMQTTHLSCSVCKTRLSSIEEVSGHIRDHMTRKDLPVSGRGIRKVMECDVCGDFYGTKANYYYHQWAEHGVVHPPIKGERLTEGNGGTPSKPHTRRLKSDPLSYVATGQKKFPCKFCSVEVKVSGKTYVKHLDTKHGLTVDVDCICRICAEIFETAERLSDHLRGHHLQSGEYVNAGVQSIFSCDKCTFFGHLAGVVAHSTMVHCDSTPSLYECPHCPERMPDRRLWRLHLEKHEENRVFDCVDCCLHFRSEPMLAEHLLSYHGVPATQGNLQIKKVDMDSPMTPGSMLALSMECDICKKICKSAKALEVHRMKHFRTRIFQCTECQATFRSKMAMRRHIRVEHLHLEPERYECQICGKIVTQISMHMLIHKNARYQCDFCEKRFTKSAYYNEHLRIHKGERPYECHICQRRFNKKSNLNVHVAFHEKHRDDFGNYLEIKPRGRGHPDYDPEKTKARKTAMIKFDAVCGPDHPGLCMHDDTGYKMMNVMTNSKICDTDDLEHYIELLQTQEGPEAKRRKC